MMLRDIKSIHDVLLAYHNKYKLMNKAGKYFKIINIEEAKTRSTPGYYITLQWRDKQPEYRLDKIIENFKIVLIDKENKMEVKDIKTIHDVILAWNNRQCLIDNDGNIFAIEYVKLIPNVGYKVMYQAGNNRYAMDFNDVFTKAFKIILAIDMDKQDLTSTNYINENKKENKMEGYIERIIQEHKELVPRIQKLHNWVYGGAHEQVDATEFANECIQLKAMKVYEEALRARLFNAGVNFVDGEYLISIDSIEDEKKDTPDND